MTWSGGRRWWFAAVPALTALALGVWGIGATGPWLDEVFTIDALVNGMLQRPADAPYLPYFSVLWLWSGLGSFTSIEWLRGISVVATVTGTVLVALTANRLAGRYAGFAAGMMFALAPGIARYGQEARPYALPTALVALATLALVVAMDGGRRRWWVVYGLALGAATLVLPISLAAIPAHAVIVTGFPGWREKARDWLAACLFLVPLAAVEALLAVMFPGLHSWLAMPSLADLPAGLTFPITSEYSGSAGTTFAVVLIALATLTATGLRWLAGTALSVVAMWVMSVTMMSWWTARSFLPLAALVCVAAGLSVARTDWTRVLVLTGILAVVSLPAHRAVRDPGSRGVDPRDLASIVAENGSSGDVIVVPSDPSLLGWAVTGYLGDDERFRASTEPGSGRWWAIQADASCSPIQTWSLADGRTLSLCR